MQLRHPLPLCAHRVDNETLEAVRIKYVFRNNSNSGFELDFTTHL